MFSSSPSVGGSDYKTLYSCSWSWVQDKQFETALSIVPETTSDRWEQLARRLPGKTPGQVQKHYEILFEDVMKIEAGFVELPKYADEEEDDRDSEMENDSSSPIGSTVSKILKTSDGERKRGTPWTEEEHKLFLYGLQKYGKGDWRSISRNAVVSRTPTQVASHAQKYFNRIKSGKKEKKRSSIHDIVLAANEKVKKPETNAPIQQTVDPRASQVPFSLSHQLQQVPSQGGSLESDIHDRVLSENQNVNGPWTDTPPQQTVDPRTSLAPFSPGHQFQHATVGPQQFPSQGGSLGSYIQDRVLSGNQNVNAQQTGYSLQQTVDPRASQVPFPPNHQFQHTAVRPQLFLIQGSSLGSSSGDIVLSQNENVKAPWTDSLLQQAVDPRAAQVPFSPNHQFQHPTIRPQQFPSQGSSLGSSSHDRLLQTINFSTQQNVDAISAQATFSNQFFPQSFPSHGGSLGSSIHDRVLSENENVNAKQTDTPHQQTPDPQTSLAPFPPNLQFQHPAVRQQPFFDQGGSLGYQNYRFPM